VSSTRIRELLDAGDVRAAAQQLGRLHALRSVVVTGEQIGRELGFPTANLDPAVEGYIPLDGVYATWATIDGVRYPAATSIGNNPTFEGVPEHRIEAHLIDQRLDAYGKTIELEFVERLRGMVKFPGVEELRTALAEDVVQIRRILHA
jgi:riboflavin kinase/FMN adenylyltransferase